MKKNIRYHNIFLRKAGLLIFISALEVCALPGQEKVTFALLTDLHVDPGSPSDSALNKITGEINSSEIDFTIISGDLTNTGSDAELEAVKKALDKLKKPYHIIPGNHETNWSGSAGLTFNRLWGDDRFSFTFGRFRFVGFNTGPFMRMGDGMVKQEDLQWLKRILGNKQPGNQILIAVSHYPLSDGLGNWSEVTGILKSAGCRIAFCGHGHKLSLYNFDDIPGIMGRPQVFGNSGIPGYNIIEINGDSVLVYNKVYDRKQGAPDLHLNFKNHDCLAGIPVSPKADYSVNKEFPGIKAYTLFEDTASVFTGPCIVNDTLLVYGNSAGYIKGISLISNRVLWKTEIAGPVYSTPVFCKGILVMGSVDGRILGLNASDGNILWQVKTGGPVLAEGIAEKDCVYIGGHLSFYKIKAASGKIVWHFDGVNDLIQGSPALSERYVVFGAWDRNLYCLDKKAGALNWKWNNRKPQKLYSPGNITPVCSQGRVFIVAPDRFMTSIDLETGKEIWRTNSHQVRESMGISPDGSCIYAKLMNDTIIAMSATENYPKTIMASSGGFGYEHNPCPVAATAGIIFAATRSGMVVAFDADTKEVIWKYKAGNSSVNKVVPSGNGIIWLTLTEGKIISIRSPQP